MTLTERTGFFAEYYLNLKNAHAGDFDLAIEPLAACASDSERVAFVERLPWVRSGDAGLLVRREYAGKNATTAAELKERGNLAFKTKKWLEAMVLYSKSYVALPADRAAERAIALANRSATLYHLQKFEESLIDIQRALELGYPPDLLYKLHERQARCFMALKNYPQTIGAFKECITRLDEAKLPQERSAKIYLDAMTMIKMLENDPRTAKQAALQQKKGGNGDGNGNQTSTPTPTLRIPDEAELVSEAIRFDQNAQEGRFARAAVDVKVGEELLVEKPYVAVLLEKFAKTHCEHCFVRTAIPVACPSCADVVYCSEGCQQAAAGSYHKFECGLLPTIWRSGASVNCHMALRICAAQPLDDLLLALQRDVDAPLSVAQIQQLPKRDYRRVAHLVRHEATRSASNFFQHTLMARFLAKCLRQADYFGAQPREADVQAITALLLRSLQFIQFNTHEVAELHKSQCDGSEKSVFIGGALYPTLALFNHSCDPGIVRYFRGTTIHVNAIRPIAAGLPINENYGPIYTQEPREERQAKLQELYWFECCCDACLDGWPTFDRLPTDVIRFRCDAANNCGAVIEVPPSCSDFMVTCATCGEATNILKGLKVMQDTEMMTRTGRRLYDAGDYAKALNKFVDLVKIMYEVLAPPFPDFCQCQQHLKDCFLHFGNFYNLD